MHSSVFSEVMSIEFGEREREGAREILKSSD